LPPVSVDFLRYFDVVLKNNEEFYWEIAGDHANIRRLDILTLYQAVLSVNRVIERCMHTKGR
jgi:hypothetical protein